MITNKDISRLVNKMTIRERSDGRLEGRLMVNGKNKSFYGKTRADIKNKAKEYLMKIDSGYIDTNIKFGDYMEHWLEQHEKRVDEQTIMAYRNRYNVYVKNTRLANKKMCDISTDDIQELLNECIFSGKLAYSSTKCLRMNLNVCFNAAVKDKIISINPIKEVCLPKQSKCKTKPREKDIFSENELIEFKELCLQETHAQGAARKYKYKHGVYLLVIVNLGLRVGELLALKWSDIDFTNKRVFVHSTAHVRVRRKDRTKQECWYNIKDGTKTENGVRELFLSEEVLYYFGEIKAMQKEEGMDTEFICPYSYESLRSSLNYIVSKMNLQTNKYITLHSLRHTFGSVLLRNGIGVEVVSKLMGHSNPTITYNTYIHVIEEQKIKALAEVVVC